MRAGALLQKTKAAAVASSCAVSAVLSNSVPTSSSSPAAAAGRCCSCSTAMSAATSASDLAAIVAQKRVLRSKVRKDLKALPSSLRALEGLAFDKSGQRLGRGGGYYDTFLRKYQELANEKKWKQPLLVALAYSAQILELGVIPVTPHDVSVDALVSPSGVIPITTAALERM